MQSEYVVKRDGRWVVLRVVSTSKTGRTVQLEDEQTTERLSGRFDPNDESISIKGGIKLGGPAFQVVPKEYLHTFPSYEADGDPIPMSRGDVYVIEKASVRLHAQVKNVDEYRGYVRTPDGRVRNKQYSPSPTFLRAVHRDFMECRRLAGGE